MGYNGEQPQIDFGELGLLTDRSPNKLPVQALILAKNITLNEGRAQKAPGAREYNATPLPGGIIGCHDWWPTPVIQRMIAACDDGNIYRDNGTGSFAYNSGLPLNAAALVGLNPSCQFVDGGSETAGRDRKLFFFSRGQNQVQVLTGDGSAFRAITTPAADWATGSYPRCGVLHRNHLFVFAGQTAYGSDTGNHEDFTTNDFLLQPVFPGEGGDIIGAKIFKGRLFCWKDGGDFGYYLDDSDIDSDNWNWKQISSSSGISSTNGVACGVDDMLIANANGTVTSYVATQSLGDVESADIFKNAEIENYLRGNTSKAGLDVQHALYYAEKKQFFFTYRSAYYTSNNMLVCVDVSKQAPRITFLEKGMPNCLSLRRDGTRIKRPMYGSADGRIYLMDQEDRVEGSLAYLAEFQTPHIDFGSSGKNKLFDWLGVTYVPQGNWSLFCDYFIDGKYIDTIEFSMAQYQKPLLNVLELSTDRLGQINTETGIRRITGSGRTISFRFYNQGLNQSFEVTNITCGFRPSGEDAEKTDGSEE